MQCFTSMLILHFTIVRSVVVFVCLFVECFLFICLFIICLLRFCVWLIICLFWIDWWWWCGRSVYLTLGSQLRSGKCVKNVESFVENHLSHKKTIFPIRKPSHFFPLPPFRFRLSRPGDFHFFLFVSILLNHFHLGWWWLQCLDKRVSAKCQWMSKSIFVTQTLLVTRYLCYNNMQWLISYRFCWFKSLSDATYNCNILINYPRKIQYRSKSKHVTHPSSVTKG